jgi:hypothetical protein
MRYFIVLGLFGLWFNVDLKQFCVHWKQVVISYGLELISYAYNLWPLILYVHRDFSMYRRNSKYME